jgi:hypothetical protein
MRLTGNVESCALTYAILTGTATMRTANSTDQSNESACQSSLCQRDHGISKDASMRNYVIRLLCLVLVGLAAPSVHAQPDVTTLVQGNSDFAFALHQQLAEKDGNLNEEDASL